MKIFLNKDEVFDPHPNNSAKVRNEHNNEKCITACFAFDVNADRLDSTKTNNYLIHGHIPTFQMI